MTTTTTDPPVLGYRVHVAAALFPMLPDDELNALAQDIKDHGLKQPIVLTPDRQVLDGRNRLAALARNGVTTLTADQSRVEVGDPFAYVISANIRRRHLTKQAVADLILTVTEAELANDSATVARSFNPAPGQRGGSTKDPILERAIPRAAAAQVSKRTLELTRTKRKQQQRQHQEQQQPPTPPTPTVSAKDQKMTLALARSAGRHLKEVHPVLAALVLGKGGVLLRASMRDWSQTRRTLTRLAPLVTSINDLESMLDVCTTLKILIHDKDTRLSLKAIREAMSRLATHPTAEAAITAANGAALLDDAR